jgi:hypothetical protein
MNESSEINIRAFLLGRLPEQASNKADEKLFADDAFLQEVTDAEDELIDDLVSDNLPPEERDAFVRYCEHRPGMEERIRVRKVFFAGLQREAQTEPASVDAKDPKPRARTIWQFLIPVTALAAIALVAVTIVDRDHNHARQTATAPEASTAPESVSPAPTVPETEKALGTAVLFFAQHVSRGATQSAPLQLRLGARHEVTFELELPAEASKNSGQWSLTVSNARGVEIDQKGLRPRQLDSISFVSARFDSTVLAPGEYTVSLSPMNAHPVSTTWALTVIQ